MFHAKFQLNIPYGAKYTKRLILLLLLFSVMVTTLFLNQAESESLQCGHVTAESHGYTVLQIRRGDR